MVAIETFELWVSSEVPLIQGKKMKRRRRDLYGHRVIEMLTPTCTRRTGEIQSGSGQTVHLTIEEGGKITVCIIGPVSPPFPSTVNTGLENSIAGIPA